VIEMSPKYVPPGKYVPPTIRLDAFNCPHCGAYAHQKWAPTIAAVTPGGSGRSPTFDYIGQIAVSTCERCQEEAIWIKEQLADPWRGSAPFPHLEMPPSVQSDYQEADAILAKSPRGAAMLLRFAIQNLLNELGEEGDPNKQIGSLVKKGLRVEVQQGLDAVRVIGNNAVHPLQMDLKDDHGTCGALFALINMIVEDCIARPKATEAIYQLLPEGAREAIEKRDQGK